MSDYLGAGLDGRVVDLLKQTLPDLLAVYAFGSAGTPYMRRDSDLDLAFLTARPEQPVMVWDLAQRVAGLVSRDVDLIDLGRASTVMAARIVSEGARLFCADHARCSAFEAYTLADYARLNEERREILRDIAARGSVHA